MDTHDLIQNGEHENHPYFVGFILCVE